MHGQQWARHGRGSGGVGECGAGVRQRRRLRRVPGPGTVVTANHRGTGGHWL